MAKQRILLAVLCLLVGGGVAHTAHASPAGTTYFDVTDEAGRWFDTGNDVAGTRSLAIVQPGETIKFLQQSSRFSPSQGNKSRVESRHTITSLKSQRSRSDLDYTGAACVCV